MTPEDTLDSTADSAGVPKMDHPVFLHEKEVQGAIRAVSLVAAGRNPFSPEPFDKLRPEQRDSILRALCIVISSLAHSKQQTPSATESWIPSEGAATAGSRRPLEDYLQRVEREAILEALAEAKYNRTAAAKLLGITFRALRYRLESLGIELENDEA